MGKRVTPVQVAANRRNSSRSTGPRTKRGKAVSARNALRHGLLSRLQVLPELEKEGDWQEHMARIVSELGPVSYLETTLAERCAHLLWRLGRVARVENAVALARKHEAERGGSSDSYTDLVESSSVMVQGRAKRVHDLRNVPPDEVVDGDEADQLLTYVAALAQVGLLEGDHNLLELHFEDVPDDIPLRDVPWTAGRLLGTLQKIVDHADLDLDVLLEGSVDMARLQEEDAHAEDSRRRERFLLPPPDDLEKLTRYETTLERSLFRTLHELERLQRLRSGGFVPPPAVLDVTVDRDQ